MKDPQGILTPHKARNYTPEQNLPVEPFSAKRPSGMTPHLSSVAPIAKARPLGRLIGDPSHTRARGTRSSPTTSKGPTVKTVTHFSESVVGPRGHGVHSAFVELAAAHAESSWTVHINSGPRTGVLHIHTMGPLALLKLLRHRGPKVVSAHITPATLVGSISGAHILSTFVAPYMRTFFSFADMILAVSTATAKEITDMGVDTPTRVLPNGVSIPPCADPRSARKDCRDSLGIHDDALVVLAVGQRQPRKGIDDFVACARLLPDVTFIWVGSTIFGLLSSDRRRMRRLERDAPPNVRFVAHLPRRQVWAFYRAADVFMHPSHHETFGLAVLEAAASGLPIVVRRLPVYEEIFGHSSVATKCESVREFASAVSSLQSAHTRQIKGAAAQRVSSKFSSERIGAQAIAIYEELEAPPSDPIAHRASLPASIRFRKRHRPPGLRQPTQCYAAPSATLLTLAPHSSSW